MTYRTPVQAPSGEQGRGARRAEACAITTQARTAAGLTMAALAADVGCPHQAIQRAEDASDTSKPVHADVWLAPLLRKEAARALCAHAGMIAIDVPHCAQGSAMLESIAEISRETSDVVTATIAAISDGVVTRAEREAVRQQIREAQEALARLDRALELVSDDVATNVHAIGAKR
jgi:uncharacterized membrane protein YebE (DUF533 family)